MTKIGLGIIGAGQIGKQHIENYLNMEDAQIVAVSDINEKELEHVKSKYHISKTYTDFRKLLKRDDIEAVDICVHNNLHAPIAIEAFSSSKEAVIRGNHSSKISTRC